MTSSPRILVLQHMTTDGPAYLATWLRARGLAFDVFDTGAGEAYPAALGDYAALAVLGGEMGANDDLPSLREAEALIRAAMDAGRPVIGHCLGGQLMARALGALVERSPRPEVGWHRIAQVDAAAARDWFGEAELPEVFQWHFDAFTLPAGATPLARSAACPHQAFALGPHLAMQFHVEVDAAKLALWAPHRDPFLERARATHDSVQSQAQMLHDAPARLAAQQRLADRIYARWLSGMPWFSHQENAVSRCGT